MMPYMVGDMPSSAFLKQLTSSSSALFMTKNPFYLIQNFVFIESWGDEVLKISSSRFRIVAFKSLPEAVDGQLQTTY